MAHTQPEGRSQEACDRSTERGGTRIVRSQILHCTGDPLEQGESAWEYLSDGMICIESGRVQALGPATVILATLPAEIEIEHYPDQILVPGFIDLHVHYPQLEMIAAHGEQLLDWLNRYTFPTELKYADPVYARCQADRFLDELLVNGTTTALVFATSAVSSVDAFFEAALQRNLRMISGKVLMDRNAPQGLLDTAQSAYDDSKTLIQRWQGRGRLGYAITPRFAPTSSDAQLELAGVLHREEAHTYVHTHLAENLAECAWVQELFPFAERYLDVYDHFGLCDERTVFAHGVQLHQGDFRKIKARGATLCHCPSSNLFLGSGLFPLRQVQAVGAKVALGSDIGAGTALSMLATIGDAYKIQQLQYERLAPMEGFYLATLGAARAIGLDQKIGNLLPGKEADMVLLNPRATPLLASRTQACESIEDLLFALTIMADDRVISQTWVMGEPVLPLAAS